MSVLNGCERFLGFWVLRDCNIIMCEYLEGL